MYVPGADEPVEPVETNTATATLTNLFLPNVRGELTSVAGSPTPVADWAQALYSTAMSPVYTIAHTFTEPVLSFTYGSGPQTSQLQMADGAMAGILFGWFESEGIGDYTQDPKWGEVYMFTKQYPAVVNGLYMALPGDVPSAGNRLARAFIRLDTNVSVQFSTPVFRATENVDFSLVGTSNTVMRIFGVGQYDDALSAAQGGIPLKATDAAWAASTPGQWLKQVDFNWIDDGSVFAGPIDHQFVFLELMHQTEPTQNGVWKYDFATGSGFNAVSPGVNEYYREFTRMPMGIPNENQNPQSRYFSHNVIGKNGALHYGRVANPNSEIEFATGSLALLLQDPGAAPYNSPVGSVLVDPVFTRDASLYEYSTVGHELETGAWLFGTSAGHNSVFIMRATQVGGVFTAGNTDADYRVAPLGTALSSLTATSFEALSPASDAGGPPITFLFLSNAVLMTTTAAPSPNFKNSGTMLCGREFEAESMAFTHTLFQQRIGSSDTALDELRVRGLSVELPGIFATHGISHSSSGVGIEHGRTPHVNVHIEDGKKTTSVDRHNIHYRALRIPHEISYKYVYTDTGEALADEHGDVIGKCTLTSQFTGFVV